MLICLYKKEKSTDVNKKTKKKNLEYKVNCILLRNMFIFVKKNSMTLMDNTKDCFN